MLVRLKKKGFFLVQSGSIIRHFWTFAGMDTGLDGQNYGGKYLGIDKGMDNGMDREMDG
jgi:hypothetical protein